jgi:phosphoglycerate dehydrogenase-like enzyme
MQSSKLTGIFILNEKSYQSIYSPSQIDDIKKIIDLPSKQQTKESIQDNLHFLETVDVIFSGWGAPKMDQKFLNAAPNLKAVFYGAGTIRAVVTPEFWEAGIPITSAWEMNAIPVAEYTLSQILFGLKLGWQHNDSCEIRPPIKLPVHGAYHCTVGLIGMGAVAKLVRNLLLNHDIKVLVYDPFVSQKTAKEWNIELVSLNEIFKRSSVVSLHCPDLPSTTGMITREHFESMPQWASFINTARSATVRHTDLCDVFEKRTDLWAILDVTEEATEEEFKRLVDLPNVVLTPHIAGSVGPECHRMGQLMVDELGRFLDGKPMKYQLNEERVRIMA